MTNILITGSTRGIGAAALSALRDAGTDAVGHGSRDGDGILGADLSDAQAADRLWDAALERLGGRIDVLVNNAGVFEAVAVDAALDTWHAAWGQDDAGQPAGRRRSLPPRRPPLPARPAGAASSTSPAVPPIAATAPRIGIMPQRRPAWSR